MVSATIAFISNMNIRGEIINILIVSISKRNEKYLIRHYKGFNSNVRL